MELGDVVEKMWLCCSDDGDVVVKMSLNKKSVIVVEFR